MLLCTCATDDTGGKKQAVQQHSHLMAKPGQKARDAMDRLGIAFCEEPYKRIWTTKARPSILQLCMGLRHECRVAVGTIVYV